MPLAVRRALLSVSDKSHLVELARALAAQRRRDPGDDVRRGVGAGLSQGFAPSFDLFDLTNT